MPHNELILLGKRLSEIRSSRGLSQEALSELCGLSARHISEIERGKTNPTYEALARIAGALGVSLVALLDFNHHQEETDLQAEMVHMLRSFSHEEIILAYRLLKAIQI